jgi:hypothetical protein
MPPLDLGSKSFWSPAHQHRLSAYLTSDYISPLHSKRADQPEGRKDAVGVSVRNELQCRESGFVQSPKRKKTGCFLAKSIIRSCKSGPSINRFQILHVRLS